VVAVVQVLGVAHQLGRGVGRAADPGTELRGGELRDLGDPLATEAAGLLAAGLLGLGRVEPVGRVEHRPLVGRTEQVDLRTARGLGAGAGEAEDLVLRHRVQLLHLGHGNSQPGTADNEARTPLNSSRALGITTR
jgi:hypothetical protein